MLCSRLPPRDAGPWSMEKSWFWNLFRIRASEHCRVFFQRSINICFLALYSSCYIHLLTINFLITSGDVIRTPQVFCFCQPWGMLIVTASAHPLPPGKLWGREFTGGLLAMATFSGSEESVPSVSGHGVSFAYLLHLISRTECSPLLLFTMVIFGLSFLTWLRNYNFSRKD